MTEHAHGYEKRDLTFRAIAAFLGGVVGLIVIAHVVSFWAVHGFNAPHEEAGVSPSAEARTTWLPPEPRLQVNPAGDLAEFRAQEDERLKTYGWIDLKNGIVRIPIARAMELLERRGLPARKEATR